MGVSRSTLIPIWAAIALTLLAAAMWGIWRGVFTSRGRQLQRVMVEMQQWQPYTVVKWKEEDDDGMPNEVIEVTREAESVLCEGGPEAEFYLEDVTGDGASDLIIQKYSGGNCGTWELTLHTRTPSIRELGHWELGHYPVEPDDLDRDGTTELVWWETDSLAGYGDHACRTPPLPMVLSYNGKQFVDATRRYPQIVEREQEQVRVELVKPYETAPAPGWFLPQLAGCAAILQCERREREWVRAHLDGTATQWVADHYADIERKVRSRETPQRRHDW